MEQRLYVATNDSHDKTEERNLSLSQNIKTLENGQHSTNMNISSLSGAAPAPHYHKQLKHVNTDWLSCAKYPLASDGDATSAADKQCLNGGVR